MHAGCAFVAGIHPSRTWTSGSFESVRWNACVHRLNLSLYSYPQEFRGNGVRTHINSKGKIPSTRKKFSSEEDRIHDAASSRTASPTHYQRDFDHHCFPPVYNFMKMSNLAYWRRTVVKYFLEHWVIFLVNFEVQFGTVLRKGLCVVERVDVSAMTFVLDALTCFCCFVCRCRQPDRRAWCLHSFFWLVNNQWCWRKINTAFLATHFVVVRVCLFCLCVCQSQWGPCIASAVWGLDRQANMVQLVFTVQLMTSARSTAIQSPSVVFLWRLVLSAHVCVLAFVLYLLLAVLRYSPTCFVFTLQMIQRGRSGAQDQRLPDRRATCGRKGTTLNRTYLQQLTNNQYCNSTRLPPVFSPLQCLHTKELAIWPVMV